MNVCFVSVLLALSSFICSGKDIYSTVFLHVVGRSSPPLVLLCKQKLTDRGVFSEGASPLLCSPLKSSRSVGEVCFPHRAVVWGRLWQADMVGRRRTCTGLRSMESNLSSVWMARVTQHPPLDVINPSTMTSHYLGGQMTLDCCRIGLRVCRDQIGTMTHLIGIQNL